MSEKKEQQMLKYLKEDADWHSVRELSIFLDVSDRTVKKYYKMLSENQSIISSKSGYKYSGSNWVEEVNKTKDSRKIPSTKQERIFYVLNKLVASNTPLNIYDLSAEIFISESNLKILFKDISAYANKFNLKLEKKATTFLY